MPDGTFVRSKYRYIRYLIPTNRRDSKNRIIYKDKKESLGPAKEVTKSRALEALADRKKKIRQGKLDELLGVVATLGEFIPVFISHQRDTVKKRSWKRDKLSLSHVSDFFGEYKALDAVHEGDLQDYQTVRQREGARPATVNRELACLKTLFNVAKQKRRFFGDNPVSKIKFLEEENERTRVLSVEEDEQLFNDPTLLPHQAMLIDLALDTGMRASEIIKLKWQDIHFDLSYAEIVATNTKSKRKKRIPLTPYILGRLKEYKLQTGFQEHVFLNRYGRPYAHSQSLRFFPRMLRRLGIAGVTFHTLRHTYATRSLEGGASFYAVVRNLGHTDPKITMRYAHPDASLFDAAEKASRVNWNKSCAKKKVYFNKPDVTDHKD